jgi:hypothetical protein
MKAERIREMKRELEIVQVENGFVIFEGSSILNSNNFSKMKWVANTPKELAELVERLFSSDTSAPKDEG